METNNTALEKLIENERLLKKMYLLFSENFAEYSEFWLEISQEEEYHAEMIERFCEKEKKGLVIISSERFNLSTIDGVKNYIERVFEEFSLPFTQSLIQDENVGSNILQRAFAMSIDIENSMIEKNVFELFETDSTELKTLLNTLKTQTIDHEKRIVAEQKKFFEEKNKNNF